ncbi:hypothetical protein GCM10008932_13340 [Alkalibacterium iburiense]|uniref:Flagellar protein n=1 Tax=Alkalibacterium iburiense TaxID=290589 RepID=A0ABN0XEV8_9LACT
MGVPELLQMIAALGVIILLANYLLKKLNQFQNSSSHVIKVLERVPLSKNSSLCIVQVGSEYLLMSMTENQNEVLKTFNEKEKEAIQLKLAKKGQNKQGLIEDSFLSTVLSHAGELIKNKTQNQSSFNKERNR